MSSDPPPLDKHHASRSRDCAILAVAAFFFFLAGLFLSQMPSVESSTFSTLLLIAGSVFALWSALKIRVDKPLVKLLNWLLEKIGLQLIFSRKRIALHLILTALLTTAWHLHYIQRARTRAVEVARSCSSTSFFIRSIPTHLRIGSAGYFEPRAGQYPLRVMIDKRNTLPEIHYSDIHYNETTRLFHASAREAGWTDDVVEEKLRDATRSDIPWRELTLENLPELEAIFERFPYMTLIRTTLYPNKQFKARCLEYDFVSLPSTDFYTTPTSDIKFAIEGDKLFIQRHDLATWVLTPKAARYSIAEDILYSDYAPKPSLFGRSMFYTVLSLALNSLAWLAPIFYLRRLPRPAEAPTP